MLNILRKRAQSFVIQAIVVLIAVVFVFWGVGSNLNNNRNAAAVVNDVEIPFQEFQQSYDRTVDVYRQQFGGQVPEGFFENLGVKNQVLNQLIEAELLRQGAEDIGVMISKEETQRRIQEMPVFQEEGQFLMSRYKDVLSQNRMTPTSFEAGLQSDMMTGKIVDLIGTFADVPTTEVQAWVDFSNTELKIAYQRFTADEFADKVEVVESDLTQWYGEHQQDYMTDPLVSLQYLYFPFAADLDQVEVDEEQVRKYYEDNQAAYTTAEQRRARHILLKVNESDSPATQEEKRNQAEHVLQLLREGGDFAALAAEYSQGPTKDSGGDLGFFARGSMVPAFEEAVFAMQPGELAGPIKTSFGYHLVRLEAVKPAVVQTLDEVRSEIVEQLKQEKVKAITFQRVSEAYENIILAGSLAKYIEQGGAAVQETGYFSRRQPPDALSQADQLLDVVFGLSKGELSSLVEVNDGYAIAYVVDRKAPEVPLLENVRERVVAAFQQEKRMELAREAAEKALAGARAAGGLQEGEGVQESAFLKRGSTGNAVPQPVIEAAFALQGNNPLAEEVVASGNALYIFEVRERRKDVGAVSKEQKQQLADQLLNRQQNTLVAGWVNRLRSEATIWINEQLLQ